MRNCRWMYCKRSRNRAEGTASSRLLVSACLVFSLLPGTFALAEEKPEVEAEKNKGARPGALIEVKFIEVKDENEVEKGDLLDSVRLMVLDGATGSASSGKERRFNSRVEVNEEGRIAARAVSETLFEGASLEAKPEIEKDRRHIAVSLKASFKRIVGVEKVNTPVIVRSGQKNTTIELEVERPEVVQTEIDTEVVVPDDGTILLAGHMQERKSETGRLLKTETAERSNVLVMLKVKIIRFEEEERKL